MKHIKNMWRCNILFLLLLGVCCHALAQNVAFIASPSAPKMGIKDQIQVTFTIRDVENLTDLRPNGFGDFVRIDGPFQSQSMSFSNGARSSSITLTYVIQPKHEGKLTIPPAYAKDAAGHTYQSNAMTIEVVPGSLAPPQQRRQNRNNPFGDDDDPFLAMQQQMQRLQQLQQQQMQARLQQMQGARPAQPQQQQAQAQPQNEPAINDAELKKDLFIKVAVDKSKVHVGEQITTSYKLYSRLPMQVAISKLPSLNGFWTQDFEIPKQPKPVEEVINGQKYQVFLLKKSALFPQEAGTLELDPAEAKGAARIIQNVRRKVADAFGGTLMMNDPVFNNAYYNTVAYKDVNVHLQSTPVKITVTPLPEKGKPEGFGGAVGSFSITGKIDKQELTTDDVATLTLNITGSGNLKLIQAPKLKLPNGITTYDPQIIDTVTGRSTTISGAKQIVYAITPHTAGDYDIPAIEFSYFNPQSGTYTTLHTEPVKMHVKPGKHYNPTHVAENTAVALKDIHDISAQPIKKFELDKKPLVLTPGYWSMYALPVLAFLGLIVWRKKSDELSSDTVLLRSKRANKIALQRLVTAKKLLVQNDRKPFHEEISKAIWLYLSDKLSIPLSALSRETATAAFAERKVPDALQKQFETVIWECETALYATGSSNKMAHTYDAAVKVISDLEGFI